MYTTIHEVLYVPKHEICTCKKITSPLIPHTIVNYTISHHDFRCDVIYKHIKVLISQNRVHYNFFQLLNWWLAIHNFMLVVIILSMFHFHQHSLFMLLPISNMYVCKYRCLPQFCCTKASIWPCCWRAFLKNSSLCGSMIKYMILAFTFQIHIYDYHVTSQTGNYIAR